MDSPQPIGKAATISAPHMHGYCLELLKDVEAKISEVTGLEKNLHDLDSQEKEKRKGATPHQQQSKEEKTTKAAPKSSGSEKSSSSSEKSSSPSPKTAPAVLQSGAGLEQGGDQNFPER